MTASIMAGVMAAVAIWGIGMVDDRFTKVLFAAAFVVALAVIGAMALIA